MHAASSPIGPGGVNLLTGNFRTSTEDVSIDSYASDLTVGRIYNSRDSTAGTDGPFGPGWLPASRLSARAPSLSRSSRLR